MKPAGGSVDMFDRSADVFTSGIDSQIEAGSWVRGDLFIRMASRYFKPGGRVLDYGCGPGRIAIALARKGYDVTGVDQSTGMIRVAHSFPDAGSRVQFHLIDRLPGVFESNTWDGIVCSSVIEYIEDPLETLSSFLSALKPGGALILSYANARTLWRLYTLYHRRRHPHLNFQYNVWTWPQARHVLTRAGFDVLWGPEFFESPFDKYRGLRFLSRLGCIGTLGLVVLRKPA